MDLQIAKWGNSLALRIPSEVVRRLGLREGATVEAQLTVDGSLSISVRESKSGTNAMVNVGMGGLLAHFGLNLPEPAHAIQESPSLNQPLTANTK